jgi:D-glycero-D-manno-heptose 1,7-bisphosphate phosphatase
MNKAVFLDKDGTLIPDIPYNIDTSKITFTTGAFEALHLLQEQDYLLVIVSNQSGIAKGYFTEEAFRQVPLYFIERFLQEGLLLSGFYFCPHYPGAAVEAYATDCDCRKPQPAMLLQAAAELNIDLRQSWMIGDILHDVEAGNRAGCRTILLNNGNETEWKQGPYRVPAFMAQDLPDAAGHILSSVLPYETVEHM